jgi:hypothetical protein
MEYCCFQKASTQFWIDLNGRCSMKTQNKLLMFVVLGFFVLLFSGCAGPGAEVHMTRTMPDGDKLTIVDHKQSLPTYLTSPKKAKLDYMVDGGDVTDRQTAAVATVEDICHEHTANVTPNPIVSIGLSGLIYTGTGWIGGGLAAKAFPGAISSQYGQYNGTAEGFGGVGNGIISLGGWRYTFDTCGEDAFSLKAQYGVKVMQRSPW